MLKRLSQSRIEQKRVLLRVDFNVPIRGRKVEDDFRVRAHLPTIERLLKRRNIVILLAHHSDQRQTLRPVAWRLAGMLKSKVTFIKNPFSRGVFKFSQKSGKIFMLENLRLWPGEEKGDLKFAKAIARLGDVFVNDAFGVAHRPSASNVLLPRLLPSYLGLLFEKELAELGRVISRPRRPLVAAFGGAKIETKLKLLKRFSRFADKLCVGGMVANALLAARGVNVGRSFIGSGLTRGVNKIAYAKNIILPVDAVVASSKSATGVKICELDAIGNKNMILDIGPKTSASFIKAVARAGTIVWNGPFGFAETRPFDRGTLAFAKALVKKQSSAVIGGGDTVAFLDKAHLLNKFRHISTGGGAMLAYLAGEKLPALEALRKSKIQMSNQVQNPKIKVKSDNSKQRRILL